MKRFWDKVEKTNDCWNWIAGTNCGYGIFRYQGKTHRSHRFMWFLIYGNFPKSLLLHMCDNPKCVNPDHLFEGTQKQNVADMVRKKRGSKGRGNTHKLTEFQVKEVKQLYIPYKMGCSRLAEKYSVTPESIRQIIAGITWKHI